MLRILLCLLLLSVLYEGSAEAALIDFRTESYSCATCGGGGDPDNDPSAQLSVNGDTWTFTPQPQPAAKLYWDSTDGFGVRYAYEADEIEGAETLELSFSQQTYVAEIYLSDLFNENGYLETGWYELNNSGNPVWFAADAGKLPSPASNGERTLTVNQQVSSITFGAPGQGHEFSVAGVRTAAHPTPEPAAAVLFPIGAAIVGYAVLRQRKLRAQS